MTESHTVRWDIYLGDAENVRYVSMEEIKNFEQQTGKKLPEDYLEIIRLYAGMHPTPSSVEIQGRFAKMELPIRCLFYFKHTGDRRDRLYNIFDVWREEKKIVENYIFFASDPGDNGYFAFDYSSGGQPKVVYLMLDSLDAGPMFIANSFTEFLEKLH